MNRTGVAEDGVLLRRLWPDPGPLSWDDLTQLYAPVRPARPGGSWLRANFVTSLDGAVEVGGYSRGLAEPVDDAGADQRVLRLLRHHADAVMVGAGTLRQEGYGALRLSSEAQRWRVGRGLSPQPPLVIVSGSLGLDPADRLFTAAPVRPILITHAAAPAARVKALAEVADLVRCGAETVDLAEGLAHLRQRGLTQILTEGGPHLFGALLAADVVDELCLSLSPLLAGAGAMRIVAGPPRSAPARMRPAHLIAAGDLLLTRYVRA